MVTIVQQALILNQYLVLLEHLLIKAQLIQIPVQQILKQIV
jgi:hypothetical protein